MIYRAPSGYGASAVEIRPALPDTRILQSFADTPAGTEWLIADSLISSPLARVNKATVQYLWQS